MIINLEIFPDSSIQAKSRGLLLLRVLFTLPIRYKIEEKLWS
jgi:hypothetical protein